MSETKTVRCIDCVCDVQDVIIFRRARRPTGCSRRRRGFISVEDANGRVLRRQRGCCNGYIDVEFDPVPDTSTRKDLSTIGGPSLSTSYSSRVPITTVENVSSRTQTTDISSETPFISSDRYSTTVATLPVGKGIIPAVDDGRVGAIIGVVAAASVFIIVLLIFLGLCIASNKRSKAQNKRRRSTGRGNNDNSTDTMLRDDESAYYSTIPENKGETAGYTPLKKEILLTESITPYSNDYFVLEVDQSKTKNYSDTKSTESGGHYTLPSDGRGKRNSQIYDILRTNEAPEEEAENADIYNHLQTTESEYDCLHSV